VALNHEPKMQQAIVFALCQESSQWKWSKAHKAVASYSVLVHGCTMRGAQLNSEQRTSPTNIFGA